MIDVRDIRAITETARNGHLVKAIEDGIKEAASQGLNYKTFNIEASKGLTRSIVDYFRNAGFIVDYDYKSAGINPVSGITIYTIKILW